MDELIERMRVADRICAEAGDYIKDAERRERQLNESLGWKKLIGVVACIVLAFIVLFVMSKSVMSEVSGKSFIDFAQGVLEGDVSLSGIVKMIVFPLIIAIVGSIIVTFVIGIVNDMLIDSIADTAHEQAKEVIISNQASLAFLPREYRKAEATSYILRLLEQGRAQGLSEAYDKCDTHLYQLRMMKLCDRMLEAYSDSF